LRSIGLAVGQCAIARVAICTLLAFSRPECGFNRSDLS
jgi:hypothetical protein